MAEGKRAHPAQPVKKAVRVVLLGAAGICYKTIRGISFASGVEVVAVGSRSLAKAEALIASNTEFLSETVKAYGSYDEALAHEGADAVYMPLPSAIHLEWVRKAAARGLHIMLEKPICVSAVDLEEIMKAVELAGVQLMDGTMWMHNPRTRIMETVIRDTALFGKVLDVNAIFCFRGDNEFFENNLRTKPELDPLGCLGDLGWYCIRAALWAFNFEAPESVQVHAGATFNAARVPMHASMTLLWPGPTSRRATIACSFDQPLTQRLEISGTEQSITLRDFVIPINENRSHFITCSNHSLGDYAATDVTLREDVKVPCPKPQESLMWKEFARCVRKIRDDGGQPESKWPMMAKLTMQVLLALNASAIDGGKLVSMRDFL